MGNTVYKLTFNYIDNWYADDSDDLVKAAKGDIDWSRLYEDAETAVTDEIDDTITNFCKKYPNHIKLAADLNKLNSIEFFNDNVSYELNCKCDEEVTTHGYNCEVYYEFYLYLETDLNDDQLEELFKDLDDLNIDFYEDKI